MSPRSELKSDSLSFALPAGAFAWNSDLSFPRDALGAAERIAPVIQQTPLTFSESLSKSLGLSIWLKAENLQLTGSFKLRGAANAVGWITQQQSDTTIVTASSGNHGLGMAEALRHFGAKGRIFVPRSITQEKMQKLRSSGIPLEIVDADDCFEAEVAARKFAEKTDGIYISPYNDPAVIAGQSTIGLEILDAMTSSPPDAVFVALGTGGLASGIGAVLKSLHPSTIVIGAGASASPAMTTSLARHEIVTVPVLPSVADGVTGNLEAGAITYSICAQVLDQTVDIPEQEIVEALQELRAATGWQLEGSSALPLAALKRLSGQWIGKKVVLVLCGGNP